MLPTDTEAAKAAMWKVSGGQTCWGACALLRAAADGGVGRIVVMSSRAVFGRPVRTRVGDNHPPSPTTHYGALKVALESLAGVYPRTACIRPTGVYGITHPPSRSKWFDLARNVIGGHPVTAARTSTEVHGDDVAAAVWILLTAREADMAGRAFNCSDLVVSTREIAERMYALHRGVAGPTATLPEELPPPENIMRCDGLRALGWRPGGQRRLQRPFEPCSTSLNTWIDQHIRSTGTYHAKWHAKK